MGLVKDSSVPRNIASPEQPTRGGAVERAPTILKDRTSLLTACPASSQLDRFVALALQQHCQQSALCKGRGRGHNVVFAVFHKRLLGFDSALDRFPYGTFVLLL